MRNHVFRWYKRAKHWKRFSAPSRPNACSYRMPDVQYIFHKALTVLFAKFQYLYSRRKFSPSSIEWYRFASNVCGSYAHLSIFPYKLPLNKNAKALRLCMLHQFAWYKRLRKDYSIVQTVYDFPVVTCKKVNLPETLLLAAPTLKVFRRPCRYNYLATLYTNSCDYYRACENARRRASREARYCQWATLHM